jgi:hypothetical protein
MDITHQARAMHESGMGQKAICKQLKVGAHRLAHIIGLPEWRLFAACEECGVDAAHCCRQPDNKPAHAPCRGRVSRPRAR